MAEEKYLTSAEHTEFARRYEENKARTDKRLELVEAKLEAVAQQANKTELLAQSVSNLAEAVKEQSVRISALEGRDGDKWRTFIKMALTVAASVVAGYLLAQLGI